MESQKRDILVADIKAFIDESQGTNDYCYRSLLCSALVALEEDMPNITEAKRRLHQCIDRGSRFVDPPTDMLHEIGENP